MKQSKGLPWFRFYADAINDLNISKLSDGLFRIWVEILCVASKYGGTLPGCEEIAFLLRRSDKHIEGALKKLIDAGLIDETAEGLRPHNWDRLQYKSDNSTERANASRERKRNAASNVAPTVAATAPEREGDTDADADRDAESESEGEKKTPARAPVHELKTKTTWPEGFALTPEHIRYAANKNYNSTQCQQMFERFANHHRAKGTQFEDWNFAWRSWVDKQVEFSTGRDSPDRNYIDGRL